MPATIVNKKATFLLSLTLWFRQRGESAIVEQGLKEFNASWFMLFVSREGKGRKPVEYIYMEQIRACYTSN